VLNSTDDTVHPVGRGVLAGSCTIGSAFDDAANFNTLLIPSTPVVMLTTLTLTSDKPSLENRSRGTAERNHKICVCTDYTCTITYFMHTDSHAHKP